MLSTVALRSGAFQAIVRPHNVTRAVSLLQARCNSSTTAATQVANRDKANAAAVTQIANWDKAHEIFYGPERDTKNFPHPVQAEYSPPVRLGFIPETWFHFFYNKTGVTGPYLFGVGLVTTLLSKEIWVVDHGFSEVIGFWGAMIIIAKWLGPRLGKYLDEKGERYKDYFYTQPVAEAIKSWEDAVKTSEEAIWREGGRKYIFEAKKENIDLQLEAIYRKRLQEVHQEVKSRLDYLTDVQSTKRRFEQDHMVNWIVNGVVGSITPQQEKESLNKCIADLKLLSVSK